MILYESEKHELERYTDELDNLRQEWSDAEIKVHELRDRVHRAKENLYRTVVDIMHNHYQYQCPKCGGYMRAVNSCYGWKEGLACMECQRCHFKGPLFPSKYDAVWQWFAHCNKGEDGYSTLSKPANMTNPGSDYEYEPEGDEE